MRILELFSRSNVDFSGIVRSVGKGGGYLRDFFASSLERVRVDTVDAVEDPEYKLDFSISVNTYEGRTLKDAGYTKLNRRRWQFWLRSGVIEWEVLIAQRMAKEAITERFGEDLRWKELRIVSEPSVPVLIEKIMTSEEKRAFRGGLWKKVIWLEVVLEDFRTFRFMCRLESDGLFHWKEDEMEAYFSAVPKLYHYPKKGKKWLPEHNLVRLAKKAEKS